MNNFQFIKGYVKIYICGDEMERFMNLCCNHDICLWNIVHEQKGISMNMYCKDFLKIRPIVKKTKTKVVILKKNGLPFLFLKMKKRIFFTSGVFLCILYLGVMSNRIWAIEITGNKLVSTDVFMDFLNEEKIYFGMPKTDVVYESLEADIRERFNVITWASVQLDGTKLVIKLNENMIGNYNNNKDNINHENRNQFCNIMATKEGTIVSIVTRVGIPKVVEKQIIQKGDLLILGALPVVADDNLVRYYNYVEPDADIFIQCNYEYEDLLPFHYNKKVYTGKKEKILFAQYRNFFLPFFHPKRQYEKYVKYDTVEMKNQIKLLDNLYLPIFYGEKEWREYNIKSFQYSEIELQELLYLRFDNYLLSLKEKGIQILSKNVTIEKTNKNMSITGTVIVIEKTGTLEYLEKYPIEVENEEQ
ncbi:MAG TPA: sporulation protein YqfD [Lachnospiraceae bacterium]|nr:sporulation protein YqfD [Lachnospiraceae bacterium]